MKWGLFRTLLLSAPALLLLVQGFLIRPAIFFIGDIAFTIPKATDQSRAVVTLTFIGILTAHFLIYGAIFLLISMAGAKSISLIGGVTARAVVFACVCLALASVTFLPVYGGGGHGPIKLGPL